MTKKRANVLNLGILFGGFGPSPITPAQREPLKPMASINNKEQLIELVSKKPFKLELGTSELCQDKDVVMAAMQSKNKSGTYLFLQLNESVRDNAEILRAALDNSDAPQVIFNAASSRLKSDYDMAVYAIDIDGLTMRYLSNELKNDVSLVSRALQKLQFITLTDVEENPTVKGLFTTAFSKNENANKLDELVELLPDELKDDDNFIKFIADKTIKVFDVISERLANNREFIKYVSSKIENGLRVASPELQDDDALVLEMVKQDGFNLIYASPRLKANRTIVIEAISNEPFALRDASQELKNDSSLVALAVLPMLRFAFDYPNATKAMTVGIAISTLVLAIGLGLGCALAVTASVSVAAGLATSAMTFFAVKASSDYPGVDNDKQNQASLIQA